MQPVSGAMGNCYFLAAIASIAETPMLIQASFPGTQELNQAGIYCVRFCRDGEWRYVVVDDRLPLNPKVTWKKKLLFAKSGKNNFWVPIVEKAWAKLNGSYCKTSSGHAGHAIFEYSHSLKLNVNIKLESMREDAVAREELFDKLKGYLADGSMLCASSASGSDTTKNKNNIVQGHAFSVLGLFVIDDADGNELNLIEVRNPWASGEWSGPFSDGDEAWERIPEETREAMSIKDDEDGIFYMEFSDFCDNFRAINLARAFPGADYKIVRVCTEVTSDTQWIEVNTATGGDFHILIQPQEERALGDDGAPNFVSAIYTADGAEDSLTRVGCWRWSSQIVSEVDLQAGGRTLVKLYIDEKCSHPACRAYVHIAGPRDMELVNVEEGFEVEEEEEEEGDDDKVLQEKQMTGLVREFAEVTGWNNQWQVKYTKSFIQCELTARDVLNALAEDTFRDILTEKEAGVPSAKSYQRCQKVANKILQMQEVLADLSEAAEWDEDAVNELTLNFVSADIASVQDLAFSLSDEGDLAEALKIQNVDALGASAMSALNKWASAYRSPEDIFLYGFHSSMCQGHYVKMEEIANNMPVYECQSAPRWLLSSYIATHRHPDL